MCLHEDGSVADLLDVDAFDEAVWMYVCIYVCMCMCTYAE
jgi:hypothetical protein